MKLFKIYRIDDDLGWDELEEIVVRAENEESARKLAASRSCSEGKDIWYNQSTSTCEEITQEGVSEIICVDFRNG